MTQFILIWWIASTVGSTGSLAIATIAGILPFGLLSPLGGVLADRLPRRTIMIVTDSISAICILVLILLFSSNNVQLWHVYTLMFIRSSMQAFQSPAFASSIPNLVPTDWVDKVAGMNQTLGGIMMLVAPPLGALALASLPLQSALMIDVFTAIIGIVPIVLFTIPQPKETQNKTSSLWADFREGVHFVRGDRGLSGLYLLLSLVTLILYPAISMTPLVVKDLFGGGAGQLALLQSASGIGFIVGGLLTTVLPRRNPVRIMLTFYTAASAAIAVTAFIPANAFWLIVVVWFVASVSFSVGNAKVFGMIQTVVPNEVLGRAMSLLTTITSCATPMGLALAGWLGETIGVRGIILWSGTLCAFVCLLGFLQSALMKLEQRTNQKTQETAGLEATQ